MANNSQAKCRHNRNNFLEKRFIWRAMPSAPSLRYVLRLRMRMKRTTTKDIRDHWHCCRASATINISMFGSSHSRRIYQHLQIEIILIVWISSIVLLCRWTSLFTCGRICRRQAYRHHVRVCCVLFGQRRHSFVSRIARNQSRFRCLANLVVGYLLLRSLFSLLFHDFTCRLDVRGALDPVECKQFFAFQLNDVCYFSTVKTDCECCTLCASFDWKESKEFSIWLPRPVDLQKNKTFFLNFDRRRFLSQSHNAHTRTIYHSFWPHFGSHRDRPDRQMTAHKANVKFWYGFLPLHTCSLRGRTFRHWHEARRHHKIDKTINQNVKNKIHRGRFAQNWRWIVQISFVFCHRPLCLLGSTQKEDRQWNGFKILGFETCSNIDCCLLFPIFDILLSIFLMVLAAWFCTTIKSPFSVSFRRNKIHNWCVRFSFCVVVHGVVHARYSLSSRAQ